MGRPRNKSKVVRGEKCWRCSGCGRWKPESKFGIYKGRWNGLQGSCHECCAVSSTKWRRRNLEYDRARQNKRRAANPERARREYVRWRSENLELARRLCRESYQRNKDKIKAGKQEYRRKNPEKIQAQKAVKNASRSGKLIRPEYCEMCGDPGRIEGHHDSYDPDRWLVVTWLCRKCHAFLHARQDELLQGAQ